MRQVVYVNNAAATTDQQSQTGVSDVITAEKRNQWMDGAGSIDRMLMYTIVLLKERSAV